MKHGAIMFKIRNLINILFLPLGLFSITAFASCYGVRVLPPNKLGHYALLDFDGTTITGHTISQFPVKMCKKIPETVEIQYFNYQRNNGEDLGPLYAKQPIYVHRNMPKKFLKNQARLIEFQIKDDGTVLVLFRMKLSEVTTKFITHDETNSEKLQRQYDEMLWLGIEANKPQLVKKALENNATVEQPWMKDVSSSHYPEYVTFYAAMRSKNPEIVDLLMKAKVNYFEDERNTALFFRFEDPSKEKDHAKAQAILFKKPEYVGLNLARVLLKNGANPNYGRTIPFDWNGVKWQEIPGMPKGADLKPRPYDHLVFLAVKNNDIELVKLLLNAGVNLHYRLPADREPPKWWEEGEWFLDWAKREASAEIKDLLLTNAQAHN